MILSICFLWWVHAGQRYLLTDYCPIIIIVSILDKLQLIYYCATNNKISVRNPGSPCNAIQSIVTSSLSALAIKHKINVWEQQYYHSLCMFNRWFTDWCVCTISNSYEDSKHRKIIISYQPSWQVDYTATSRIGYFLHTLHGNQWEQSPKFILQKTIATPKTYYYTLEIYVYDTLHLMPSLLRNVYNNCYHCCTDSTTAIIAALIHESRSGEL